MVLARGFDEHVGSVDQQRAESGIRALTSARVSRPREIGVTTRAVLVSAASARAAVEEPE